MKKLLISAILVCGVMILIYGLPVGAKWIDITPLLGGEEGDTFDLKSTLKVNSLKVGSPDIGGVTYLRGSIVNDTSTGSQDNPVTFGDNVRIDGSIYRGDTMGPGVGHPVYINDDARIFGNLTVNQTAQIAGDQSVGGNSTITGNLAVNGSNGLTMGSDTNLYRNSADVLRTSDSLLVDGSVGIGSQASPTATVILDVAENIPGNAVGINVSNTDDTDSGSYAGVGVKVEEGAGDPNFLLTILTEQDWSISMDNDDGNKLKFKNSTWLGPESAVAMTMDPSTKYIGIGTTAPHAKLHVDAGTLSDTDEEAGIFEADVSANIYSAQLDLKHPTDDDGALTKMTFSAGDDVSAKIESEYVKTVAPYPHNGRLKFFTRQSSGLFEVMRLDENSNVGIGTTSPTANLTVAQSTTGTGTVSNTAGGTTVTGTGTNFTNTFKVGDTITIPATTGQTVAISAIASDTSMTTAAITNANTNVAYTLTGGTRMVVQGNGNAGIGTTSPSASAKLEIDSTTGAFLLPRMTTAERNALTAVNGMVIYNTTTTQLEAYENGSWVDL